MREHNKTDSISSMDKIVFRKFVQTRGFAYALEFFLLKVFKFDEYRLNIIQLIFEELQRYEYLTLEQLITKDVEADIGLTRNSGVLKDELKILIIYQITAHLIDNENLGKNKTVFLHSLLSYLISTTYYEKDKMITSILIKLYKNKVLFEVESFKRKMTHNLINRVIEEQSSMYFKNNIDLMLSVILILNYNYLYVDERIRDEYKNEFIEIWNSQNNYHMLKSRSTLIDIIKDNITFIIDAFPNNIDEMLLRDDEVSYDPPFKVRSIEYSLSNKDIIMIKFALYLLCYYNLIDSEDGDYNKIFGNQEEITKILVKCFIINSNQVLQFAPEFERIINNLIGLLDIDNNINASSFSELYKLINGQRVQELFSKKGFDYHIDSLEIKEMEGYTSLSIDINNKDLFGASEDFLTNIQDLVHINFGINDIIDLDFNTLSSFVDGQTLSIALENLFNKHLVIEKIERNQINKEKYEQLFQDYGIDIYNDIYVPFYETGLYDEIIGFHSTIERKITRINGKINVYLNSTKFKYRINYAEIKRIILTNDEIKNLLNTKYLVGSGIYKIKDAYFKYKEAKEYLKSNFRKDIVEIKYSFDIPEKSGFIIAYHKQKKTNQ